MTDPKAPQPTPGNYTHKTEIEPGLVSGEMRIVELETGERECIAVVINIATDDEIEMRANAKLFVAAPEVAAELERVKDALVKAERAFTKIFGETTEDHIADYALDCRNHVVLPALAKPHQFPSNPKGR